MSHPHSILPPLQLVRNQISGAVAKTSQPASRTLLLSFFAGLFIACGACASSTAMHDVASVGLSRFVCGLIFPVGLLMIMFVGGELFTGDCMLAFGAMHGRCRVSSVARTLVLVYVGNFVGALLLAALAAFGGQYNFSSGLLGAFTIKVALGKATMSFVPGLLSGIICNIFVCAAVLMSNSASDPAGRVLAVYFPVMAFAVSGTEHCVANMYYIPAGIFALTNPTYRQMAMDTYGYTAEQLGQLNWMGLIRNEIPVTIGNIIGGMLVITFVLYLLHGKQVDAE